MKNFFENISEENKKYIYWFALALSSFVIINIIFDPFKFLRFSEIGMFFAISVVLDRIISSSFHYKYLTFFILGIISYPIVFYIFYKLSIKKIHPIYFIFFPIFILLIVAPLFYTILILYACRNGGDWGCFLPIVTIPIIIISSLLAYFFYRKSEGLK
jgi:uncharacterized membrane protein YjdF